MKKDKNVCRHAPVYVEKKKEEILEERRKDKLMLLKIFFEILAHEQANRLKKGKNNSRSRSLVFNFFDFNF